jgi:glycosyltransferase involved in cell wall biosynthesis
MTLTLCLNMIVKDESHIIEKTLEMLCSKMRFHYWVICDTGSSDNTREIITQFFNKKNIPGELHCDKWVDFAHNRTLALERAFKKTDLLLVFDADDEIHGTINMPNEVLFDEYHLRFGMPKSGTNYTRTQIINNHKRFKYLSVVHEFISCQEPSPARVTILDGDYYLVSGRSGSRNKDPNKYLKDAIILENAHQMQWPRGIIFTNVMHFIVRIVIVIVGDTKMRSSGIKLLLNRTTGCRKSMWHVCTCINVMKY